MTDTMTSRERLITALDHREPDRVPIDLGGFQSGIHRVAYEALIDHLGINDPSPTILDPIQQLSVPCEEVLERFKVDVRYITSHGPDSFTGGIEHNTRDGRLWHDLVDEFGIRWSMPDDQGLYMDITHHPLADADIADIERYPFPVGGDPTRFTGVRDTARKMRDTTGFALSTGITGVVYEICWYMRGLERWFMDTIDQPAFCEALLDRTLAFWLDYHTGLMGEIGDLVDVVMVGDDIAAQHGPLFSPDFYRKIVAPRQKQLVQHIKSLTSAKVWYHSCGAVSEYIPDLLDNGVDIINPVQIGLPGMDPGHLKRTYGDRIVFWGGGIDAQHVLPFSTPTDIREHVRRNLAEFMPGGGYVFNNVHNIQAGVPPENATALFDAAHEFGSYR
jgi:uroporphyrinogen decarboxylase